MTVNENSNTDDSSKPDSTGDSGTFAQILLDYTEESLLLIDRDLKIVLFNTEFAANYKKLLKKTVRVGDSVLNYAVTKNKDEVIQIYHRAFAGETVENEIVFNREGTERCFVNKFKPVYNDLGEVHQIFAISRDVTSERLASRDLKAGRERLQKVMDQSLDLICSFQSGQIISCNAAVKQILGYDQEQFIGKSYVDMIHPDDRLQTVDLVSDIFARSEVRGFENRYQHKNGHWVPLIWSAWFDEKEQIVYAIARDATEQKLSKLKLKRNEERLTNAQKIAGIGHWECLPNQDQFLCSDVMSHILQWESRDGITREFRDLLSAVHSEDRRQFAESLNEVSTNRVSMDIQHRFVMPDQQLKYIQHRASMVEVLQTEKEVIQGTVLDITVSYRRQLEHELSAAVAHAIQQFRSLDESLAEVLRLFAEFSGTVAGEAWYVNSETKKLNRKSTWINSPEYAQLFSTDRFDFGEGLPGVTARSTKIEYWKDLPNRKRFLRKETATTLHLVTGIGIPVLVNDTVIAVFTLYNPAPVLDWTFISETFNRLSLQVGIDIQRKQATVELNQFFEYSPNLIALIGLNGFYHRVNPAFPKLLGYSEKEFLSKPFHHFVHPDDINPSVGQLSKNSEGLPTLGFVNRYITKQGDVKWIQWYSSSQLSEEGVLFGFGTDITEVKETSEQLLKFKQIIEQSRDGIGLISLQDNEVYVNDAFQKETGYSAEKIKAIGGFEKLYTDNELGKAMLQTVLNGEQWKKDMDILTPNGVLREYFLSAGPIFDDNGKLIAIYGIHTNISERKRYEKELKTAYDEKNTILESIADGFYTVNRSGEITYWNNEAEQMTGLPPDYVLGKKLTEIYPELGRSQTAQSFIDVINSAKQTTIEGFSDMHDRWIQLTTYPSDQGTSVFFRDITLTKEAEAEKELLLEVIDNSLHEVYIYSGEEMNYEYVNRGALKNLDYSTAEMRDLHPWDILPEFNDNTFIYAITPLINKKKEKIVLETIHQRKNGSQYPVEVHLHVHHHQQRMLFVAVVIDISDRKKQEKALMKLNNQLRRRASELANSNIELEQFAIEREKLVQELTSHNNDLRQFSYITSHNLRAPLSNIIGLLYLFEDLKIQNVQYQELLHGVQVSARQLQETIDDLGHIISIKNSPAVAKEKLSLAVVLDNVLLQVKLISGLKDPEVSVDFSQAPTVNFNKTYLESVLLNLMTNAIKYRSPRRPLHINIRTERVDNKTLLIFADNGIGINVNRYKDRLFGLYQRFHPEKEGKGIGLFLVKTQMEAMGGKITIKSRVGEGTTLTLTFTD